MDETVSVNVTGKPATIAEVASELKKHEASDKEGYKAADAKYEKLEKKLDKKSKKEKEMHEPVTNIFPGAYGGYGHGNGFGGGDGMGMFGGLLVGALLGRGGFGGFGGGFGGGNCGGWGGNGIGPVVQDTAILAQLGHIQGAIPQAALQVQAQLSEAAGDINLSTAQQTLFLGGEIARAALGAQQGFANVKDSVQTIGAVINANVAQTTAAVNVGTLSTAIAIRDDGDKTRALISQIDRDTLNRQLSDANNVIAELKFGRENDSRSHGIEIQMINNQNQNQLQFQAQAQGLSWLQHGLAEVGQVAKATNQNVLVGNTGATTTGPQTANPTNVKV